CFFTSLPVKIWWSRALVLWRIVLTSTGLSAGLAGSPTGPLENSQTGRAASAAGLALCQLTPGFHPPAPIDRAAHHHGVELFYRAGLGGWNHRDIQALPGQHIGDRLGDLTGSPVFTGRADQHFHRDLRSGGAAPVSSCRSVWSPRCTRSL